MINLNELQQFVSFADCGTLVGAAAVLHLSQPALSRNMRNLEKELGITLFVRKKNRIELNENGRYVLNLAKSLLADAASLSAKAQAFDRSSRTIALGVCAPAPSWVLTPLLSSLYPSKLIQTEIAGENKLLSGLNDGSYQLIVLPFNPGDEQYFTRACGRERLSFALPRDHRCSGRESLSFAEMDGENMLLMNDIGFWNFVQTEKLPNSHFLIQSDRFSFNELVRNSSLPSFTTDLAKQYLGINDDRIEVPISDPEASVTYYLLCLKNSRKAYQALFNAL